MPYTKFLTAILAVSLIAGCTEPSGAPGRGVTRGGSPSKSDIGTAAGAIGGGIIGYQFGGGAGQALATVGGALLGGILGNAVGTSMDNADRTAYDDASYRAMETGSDESWRNSRSGHYGSIHPTRYYTDAAGRYCREYSQAIYVDGQRHTGHGTACREEDGTWQIVE